MIQPSTHTQIQTASNAHKHTHQVKDAQTITWLTLYFLLPLFLYLSSKLHVLFWRELLQPFWKWKEMNSVLAALNSHRQCHCILVKWLMQSSARCVRYLRNASLDKRISVVLFLQKKGVYVDTCFKRTLLSCLSHFALEEI